MDDFQMIDIHDERNQLRFRLEATGPAHDREPRVLDGECTFRSETLQVTNRVRMLGCYLKDFANQLDTVRDRLDGVATLMTWDENFTLRIHYDSARRCAFVEGEFQHLFCVDESPPFRARVEFGTLAVDQTELGVFARAIRNVMTVTGVSTRDPYE